MLNFVTIADIGSSTDPGMDEDSVSNFDQNSELTSDNIIFVYLFAP